MHWFMAFFLGIVQGLTEFLPVSSSGHLILFQRLFNLGDDLLLFNIVLHIATLLAVLIVFREKIWKLVRNPFGRENLKMNLALVIATVITVGFVLLFKDFIDRTFTANVLPVTFFITAIVLFGTGFLSREGGEVTKKSAIATGLAQGVAVVPGFSRSGFTISTALAAGVKREAAAEFSFLMSIPIIIAALVYELMSGGGTLAGVGFGSLVVAFFAALVSGIFAIKFMLKIVKNVKLYWFSIYLIVLALVTVFII